MPRVEVEPGVSLFVQDVGEGRPIVLLAGFGLDHEVWDGQVRRLAERHRVLCVDLRGHGRSDKPRDGYDIERLARDVQTVIEHVDLRDVTLVGWSFAGQVAFRLAASAPERLAQLVLVASNAVRASRGERFPFGRPPEELEPALIGAEEAGRLAARRATIGSGFHGDPDPDTLDWLVRCSLQMPSWAAVACYRSMLRTDLVDDLPRVTMPVLQLIGANDPVHSARGARWVNERLADARIVELKGCGHFPLFEAPDAFDAALLDFVADHRPEGRLGDVSPETYLSVGGERSDVREAVERFYDAINRKDAGALGELIDEQFAPDAVLQVPESLPHGGTWEGAPALKKIFTAAAAPGVEVGVGEMKLERIAEMALDGEDHVVVELSFDWIAPGSDAPIAAGAVEWWRFKNLRVVELKAFYWDTAAMSGA